jgi:hypothetical protein
MQIEKAYFISPIVNMEKLITDMMQWAGVTEIDLMEKGTIETAWRNTILGISQLGKKDPISWSFRQSSFTEVMTICSL